MADDAPSDPVTKMLLRRRRELLDAIRTLRDSGNPATDAAILALEAEAEAVSDQALRNQGSVFASAYRDIHLTPRDVPTDSQRPRRRRPR